jgi:hypothetical protein
VKQLHPEVQGVHGDVGLLLEGLAGEIPDVQDLESPLAAQAIPKPAAEPALGSEPLGNIVLQGDEELHVHEQVPGTVHRKLGLVERELELGQSPRSPFSRGIWPT